MNPKQGPPLYLWLLVWLPVLVVSLAVTTFLFAFGLILVPVLVYLLALGVAALVAGLTGVLAGNMLIKDGQKTWMAAVLLRCELAALILALILIGIDIARINIHPPIISSTVSAVTLSLVAAYTAVTFRIPPEEQRHQGRKALLLLILAVVSIPLVIFIASLFGWAGA